MLSSSFFFCLSCLLPPFTVPCKMVLVRPDERAIRFIVSCNWIKVMLRQHIRYQQQKWEYNFRWSVLLQNTFVFLLGFRNWVLAKFYIGNLSLSPKKSQQQQGRISHALTLLMNLTLEKNCTDFFLCIFLLSLPSELQPAYGYSTRGIVFSCYLEETCTQNMLRSTMKKTKF